MYMTTEKEGKRVTGYMTSSAAIRDEEKTQSIKGGPKRSCFGEKETEMEDLPAP